MNGAAVLRLKGDQGLNAQLVAWHLLEDVLGWVAILLVSITLLFVDWYILDPILSVMITLYVLYNAVRNLRKTLKIFLQATPEQIDVNELDRSLQAIEHVRSTHHTHIWTLEGEHHVLTSHLVVSADATKADVLQVKAQIKALVEPLHLEHVSHPPLKAGGLAKHSPG